MTSAKSKSISVDSLEMTFTSEHGGSVQAMAPTSLDIAPRQFVAVVGPSGCGKSTLLNILAGFITPTGGSARIGGEEVTGPDIDHGVVFQDYALFPWLNVIDNVGFGLERMGVDKARRYETAAKYLELVGLKEFAYQRPNELSGGMKQRVAIARAFATDPSVILMDEPFGALDALTRSFLQRQLLHLWQKHKKTILFITHSVQEAVYLADRIIIMTSRPGTIKLDMPVDLSYPREFSDSAFREIEKHIFNELDEELAKTFDLQGGGMYLG